MNQRYLFTGGPGSGKSTLLEALRKQGFVVVPESARQIIRQRIAAGLSPRPNPIEFAQQILAEDISQFRAHSAVSGPIFFDRGIPDSAGMLVESGGATIAEVQDLLVQNAYAETAFIFPPWEEIFRGDEERDQSFKQAETIYRDLASWYANLGFRLIEVPKTTIADRAGFVMESISQ